MLGLTLKSTWKTEEGKQDAVLAFFSEKARSKDKEVHALAERLGLDPSELEGITYRILSTVLAGGKAKEKGITFRDIDKAELAAGEKVEMEHVDKRSPFARIIARKIALDHLAEAKDWGDPRYYAGLLRWEKAMKGGRG